MKVTTKDIDKLTRLLSKLWPNKTIEESQKIIKTYITGNAHCVFVKSIDEQYVGLAFCSLRNDYVEGCYSTPVGYLEGIVVDDNYRMKGIARYLCQECENWAKSKGCKEFASDCDLTNNDSLLFHLNMGFQETNKIICFKKEL